MKQAKIFWLSCVFGLWTIFVLADFCFAQEITSPRQLKNDSISKLESLRTGDKSLDKELDRIIKYIQKSLQDKRGSLWQDDWHLLVTATKGQAEDEDDDDDADDSDDDDDVSSFSRALKVFHQEKQAIERILKHIGKITSGDDDDDDEDKAKPLIISPETKATFEQIIEDLILADRLLVERALYQAKVYQGIAKKIDRQIDKSEQELTKAQKELQKDKPDKAIKKYEKAWEHAQLALKHVRPEIATQAANNWLLEMQEALTSANQEQLFEAAEAIIEIGPYAISPLVEIVQNNEKDIEFRCVAVELLSNIGDNAAVSPLITVLAQEEAEELRDAAAVALGVLGSQQATEALIEAMQSDPAAEVRQSAALSLGVLNDPSAITSLVAALNDEDNMVRTNALRGLGELKAEGAIPEIITKLSDQDEYVRYTATRVLAEIADESVINSLLQKLEDEDDNVRRGAIEAIASFVSPQSTAIVPALIEAIIEDLDWQVRQGTAEALIKIGQPAVPELLSAYQSAGTNQREHITYALGNIAMAEPLKTQVIEALTETLSSENKTDALNAAVALYRLGLTEEAYNFALNHLTDEEDSVRTDAARALGKMGDERAISALETALQQDEDMFVRMAAHAAIEKITGGEYAF